MPRETPDLRIRVVNGQPVRAERDWVVYWMIAARRTRSNFALQRAVEQARRLTRPLLIVEALRCGYAWASDRLHAFVLQGMSDNRAALANRAVRYYPYVEGAPGAGDGLMAALGRCAAMVVTDEFPAFFLPRMVESAGARLDVRLEAVDSNGLLPLRAAPRAFPSAYGFRAFLQRELPTHLDAFPLEDPFEGAALVPAPAVPADLVRAWRPASDAQLSARPSALARLPIDHRVPPGKVRGGARNARETLQTFLDVRLPRYASERNEPESDAASGLSPFLHFGHVSSHEVFAALMTGERWTKRNLAGSKGGRKDGWWGVGLGAEAFLDELVTWRELGYNMCAHRDDYDRYESLPPWARATLEAHAADPRERTYTLEELERAATHDALWNAAQRQIVVEGRMHNYLRMLWGKKILEWSPTPRDALAAMIHLNNKYGVDGRDPNSYSGIFWCLGRYDRPWGPERPVFGKVRYMSSENTARKLSVKGYLARYGRP
jgi:deoxyribodipyrimidine photo-lyase